MNYSIVLPYLGEVVVTWELLAIAGGALIALLALILILWRVRVNKRRAAATLEAPALEPRKERPTLEPPVPVREPEPVRPRPQAPPPPKPVESDEARKAREAAGAAEAARLEAKRLLEQARAEEDRAEAEKSAERAAQAAKDAKEAAARAAEAERLRKLEEEERKKAEYHARRQAEVEEKERRRVEAEATRLRLEEEARQAAAAAEAERLRIEEEEKRKIAAQAGKTLSEGLAKTRGGFVAHLNALFGRNKEIDESVLGELEEVLFSADIGVRTASELLEFAREKVKSKDLNDPERLKQAIRNEVARIVDCPAPERDLSKHHPYVLMVVGVNGSGKTTTTGKLASKLTAEGKKVVLAAADTFRAAATEQLMVWGERAGAEVVRGKEGSDPGAVVFDAIKKGLEVGADVVLCDTAGRLHTKAPLMEELKRVKRVMDKAMPGAPHETLLVLDSTNGQNAIAQAREFNAALEVDAIVLTKLDGTAKGGVVIGICDELKLPVRYVGIGETAADLKPFKPKEFVEALFE